MASKVATKKRRICPQAPKINGDIISLRQDGYHQIPRDRYGTKNSAANS